MLARLPFLRRVLVTLAGAALVLAWLPVGGASAEAAARSTVRVQPATGDQARSLHGDSARTSTGARRASVAWAGRRITYYETLPGKWDWSLRTAIAKWNGSGGGIRFVRTTVRSRAQVRIGYARLGRAAGMATVGRTRHGWVRLNSVYNRVSSVDAHNRVEVMAILAHELGHVLGFEHSRSRCSLMSPVLDIDRCGMVAGSRAGYYRCRTIETTLVRRFVRLYGGRARTPRATWCPLDPLPSTLPGVDIDTDPSGAVTIHWSRPARAASGSHVVIQHWAAPTCAAPPSGATTEQSRVLAESWEPGAADLADNCFRVQLVNRYGAGRAPVMRVVQPRVAAPAVEDPAGA